MKTLITGANGQLGRALVAALPDAVAADRDTLDISDAVAVAAYDWSGVEVVINAGAYTKVDVAETADGRVAAWQTNAVAVANLARLATENDLTLVHVSSEYVFDGSHDGPISEDLALSPLSAYGASKAAGDVAAATAPQHFIVRTSWVVGDGGNFVRTMAGLAEKGVKPSVVSDQIGRLSFTTDLAAGIVHLLSSHAPYGTYNLSNEGEVASWAEVARSVYELSGHDRGDVSETTTAEYFAGKPEAAQRPLNSVLDLHKIEAAGFTPRDWRIALSEYLSTPGKAAS